MNLYSRYKLCSILLLLATTKAFAQQHHSISSPDGKIVTEFWVSAKGEAYYRILYGGKEVLEASELGIIRRDFDFSQNLKLEKVSNVTTVKERYRLSKGKRLHRFYIANRQVFHLGNGWGHKMNIIFQVSNDGVAFWYYFSGATANKRMIVEEITSFNFPAEAKAWLEPLANAKTGFGKSNPSYEEDYKQNIAVGTPAPYKAGWAYPALFRSRGTWVLITETGLTHNYSGTRLRQNSPNGEYRVGFPQPGEVIPGGFLKPHSTLPWKTPWRVLTIGSLETIIESTHATDLADPAVEMDTSFVDPGHVAWSWAMLKDASVNYETQKKFIDFAAEMNWEYCLIDVNWDTNIGYEKIAQLADYAASKGIGLFLWYNSAGGWNEVAYHPRNQLLTHESRVKEFRRLQKMGIRGIKVDFFGGDGQSMMKYYQDILIDAARFGLMVNFHGSTIPRGWQRTYPNLMTMEAVKGFEFLTFTQESANQAATHAAMLLYTRNAFAPMDFTPMVFGEIPGIERVTTNGLQLAESIIFLSSIQHFAVTPKVMSEVPGYVKKFVQDIPVVWNDTQFIKGFPGRLVILARRSGEAWYVAGLNGENRAKSIQIELPFIPSDQEGTLITGGDDKFSFEKEVVTVGSDHKLEIRLKGNDGFVIVFD